MERKNYLLSGSIAFQTIAATTAPARGAAMKTQRSAMAAPLAKKAGPKLRAGLTLVPVKWMPKMWIRTSVRPMARPANLLWPDLEEKQILQK